MTYIYVLFSLRDRKLYVGKSNNLRRRLGEHKRGEAKSTKNRIPLLLIYYEVYYNLDDAEQREKYLKGGNGRGQLKIQLKRHLKKLGYRYQKNEQNKINRHSQ